MNDGQAMIAHLLRLAAVSVLWLLAAAVIGRPVDPRRRGFGLMTAAWAVVDLVIVAVAWRGAGKAGGDSMRWSLWINDGLNLLYIAAGVVILLRTTKDWWRGAGWAIILQGLTLLILDTYLLLTLRSS